MQQHLIDRVHDFFVDDGVWFAVTVSLLVISIVAVLRRRAAWSVGLLVGAVAYTAVQIFWWFIGVIGSYKMTHVDSRFAHLFYPSGTPYEWVFVLKNALLVFSLLIPVSLICWVIQFTLHLTKR